MTKSQPYLKFADDAQEVFEMWFKDLQSRLENDDDHPAITEHLGKYRSLMPSLALIFHLVDYADGKAAGPVSKMATIQAAAWCDYLETHARRLYGLALDSGQMAAAALSKKIEGGKLDAPFKVRTIQRKGWGQLTDSAVINDAVSILEDSGWIRQVPIAKKAVGGRPADPEYVINPKLAVGQFSRFSQYNIILISIFFYKRDPKMDWIKALEDEKKSVYVKRHTDKTDKTNDPNEFLWGTNSFKKQAVPFADHSDGGYPIPTDEAEFAADEKAAIIEFDGGPSMLSGTAQMVMGMFDGTIHQEDFENENAVYSHTSYTGMEHCYPSEHARNRQNHRGNLPGTRPRVAHGPDG